MKNESVLLKYINVTTLDVVKEVPLATKSMLKLGQ